MVSKLNQDLSIPQFATYSVTTQEPCDESIISELNRQCDNFKVFLTSGKTCVSPPDWSDFTDTLSSIGINECSSEDSNHLCSANQASCPNNEEAGDGDIGDSLLCCILFICTNIYDDCTLKAQANFFLGIKIFESQTAVKTYSDSIVVQGNGFSKEAVENIFKCRDSEKNDLGCICKETTGNSATLKFNVVLEKTGPIFATVKRKGISLNEEDNYVQIGEVVQGSLLDYQYYLVGALLIFVLLFIVFRNNAKKKIQIVNRPDRKNYSFY